MSEPASIANPEPPTTPERRILADGQRILADGPMLSLRHKDRFPAGAKRQRLSVLAPTNMPMPAASSTIASSSGFPASRKRLKPKYSK